LAWSARATTSLPEPLSPRSTTAASVCATVAARSSSSCMARLRATMRLHLRPVSGGWGSSRQTLHSCPPLSKGVAHVPVSSGSRSAMF
jgi:hypothetical protein